MERPSHSIIALSAGPGSRRIVGAGLSVAVQAGLVAVLIGGLVIRESIHGPGPIELSPFDKIDPTTPPPPAVKLVRPDLPTAAEPQIVIAPPESGGTPITPVLPLTPQGQPVTLRQPPQPPAPPDRPAAGIAATHSIPPYPALAQRLGAEGKVMLRLSVGADGHVSGADIIASSGRRDLDQAAQAWILGHWTYSPAIRGGVPAASQVMAAVEFTLQNAH